MNPVSKRLLVAGLAVATEIGGRSHLLAYSGSWDIDRINDSIVFFRNGETLVTELYDVHFIAKLSNGPNAELMIFSGRNCRDCCAQNAVFLYSPSEKKVVEPEYAPYDYPGREYSVPDSTVLYRSRMFYGHVLPNVNEGIIWYQEMLGEDGRYMKSVYLVRFERGRIKEELILDNPPPLEETLKLIWSGSCTELQGADYVSEQTPPVYFEGSSY